MSDPTREELEAQLAAYQAALTAVSGGQSYTIDGLELTRMEVGAINRMITQLRRQLIDFDVNAAGGRMGQRVPVWS